MSKEAYMFITFVVLCLMVWEDLTIQALEEVAIFGGEAWKESHLILILVSSVTILLSF